MQTLVRASRASSSAGELLPSVFPGLEAADFKFRRGQIALVAAAPGVGKTALSLVLALKLRVPTLYVSADTDSATMRNRACASITGHRVRDVEENYDNASDYYEAQLNAATEHIRWSFDPGPATADIDDQMIAFALAYGEYPHLLVVDSLYNVNSGSPTGEANDFGERTLEFLHELARLTNTGIVVLHHVTGQYDDGTEVVPVSGLRGKISKTPEQVLTLFSPKPSHYPDADTIGAAIVKNRNGKRDPMGGHVAYLKADLEHMSIS